MKIRKAAAALALTLTLPLAACSSTDSSTGSSSSSSSTSSSGSSAQTEQALGGPAGGGAGPGGSVAVSSVTTEEQLVELIQDAYGEASLGLHRGHQPVEDVLNEVLGISHDELHVRMDSGQNLATVAEDLNIDPQTLIDAMTAKYSPAIDALLADGTITQEQADQYLDDLKEAFEFRATWDGKEATPTYAGLDS